MQITLNLDESLLKEAFQLTNLTTQEELMNLALQEFVRSRRKKNLLDLAGQIQFAPDTQLELLQGSLNEQEWTILSTYLEVQDYVELTPSSWQAAARIYYDLRRQGLTVRSPIDCCIAQAALENDLLLIHNDRDFETIAQVRSLQNLRFRP